MSFVTLPELHVKGVSNIFNSSLDNIVEDQEKNRSVFWRKFLLKIPVKPAIIYGASQHHLNKKGSGDHSIFYVTGVEHSFEYNDVGWNDFSLSGGGFLKFRYYGPKKDLYHFFADIYFCHLPKLRVVRREGNDIEKYYISHTHLEEGYVQCEYLIPVEINEQMKLTP